MSVLPVSKLTVLINFRFLYLFSSATNSINSLYQSTTVLIEAMVPPMRLVVR